MRLILLAYLMLAVNGLNILLTTEDSWVTKNIRSLYTHLSKEHTVILIAPLRHNPNQGGNLFLNSDEYLSEYDFGDFNHLSRANQIYYKKLNEINSHDNIGAKGVHISSIQDSLASLGKRNKIFGTDLFDSNIWYVDASPVMTILTGLDVILPEFYPNFVADLVISGPKEGSTVGILQQLKSGSYAQMKLANLKQLPAISISTQDNQHVYYQDEATGSKFDRSLSTVNSKISELLGKISSSSLPESLSLNINFPSLEPSASYLRCNNPSFKHAQTELEFIKIPLIELNKHSRNLQYDEVSYNVNEEVTVSDADESQLPGEEEILRNCGISVVIDNLSGDVNAFDFNGLFDL